MTIPCNVGGGDRAARTILGLGLLSFALTAHTDRFTRVLASAAAAMALETALTQFCPVNALLGINTCRESLPDGRSSGNGGQTA